MNAKKIFLQLSILILIFGSFAPASGRSASTSSSHIHILRSDDRQLLVELVVDGYQVEQVTQAGEAYQRILIDGMAQTLDPGQPQVPSRGAMVGVPSTKGLTVRILETDLVTLTGYRLPNAPEIYQAPITLDDPAAPAGQPPVALQQVPELQQQRSKIVEISLSGYLRDQAVAELQFFPVQYLPVQGEVKLYRRILAQVTWDPQATSISRSRPDGKAFEGILKDSLLNYSEAKLPAQTQRDAAPSGRSSLPAHPQAAAPALKLGVEQDGIYELAYTDLVAAGFDPDAITDAHNLQLTYQGSPIPILIKGESDGHFDPGDSLIFYGVAMTGTYTTRNIYWLSEGSTPGERMDVRDGTPTGGSPPTYFPNRLHAERDSFYWQTMVAGTGQDHWFWGERLSPNTEGLDVFRDFTLNFANISATGPANATLRVRLKGYSSNISVNPDHRTRISLNGVQVADQEWDGLDSHDIQFTVPRSSLQEGANALRIEALPTSASVDQYFVNWIEVDYPDSFIAEDDELVFASPGAPTYSFQIEGFTSPDAKAFDITSPFSSAVISSTNSIPEGGGKYTLEFSDAAGVTSRYLAVTPGKYKTPASIELDEPSSWKSASQQADYILIAPRIFYSSTLPLADYRRSQGLTVAVVKVEDIYDEFSGGIFTPQAIRDFLTYAYRNWASPAPEYVLLVGGASYDYRGTLEPPLGRVNYVPTQMIETALGGQTASDNWFAAVNGDDFLPDLFIGRLTATSESEVTNMINKVIAYEQTPPDSSWNTKALYIAGSEDPTFEQMSDQLSASLPFYYQPTKINAKDYTDPEVSPAADIAAAINSGTLLVNYAGHGNPGTWAGQFGGRIFDTGNISALTNVNKLTIVTVANCLNGFFVGRFAPSMAEAFLAQEAKGAVAVWAPSGLGFTSGHKGLVLEFYNALFQQDIYSLGEATTTAKLKLYSANGQWGELVETFVLFGDPASRIGIANNYPYLKSTTPEDGAVRVRPSKSIEIAFSKPVDPGSIALTVSGAGGTLFTPVWNTEFTQVAFSHPELKYKTLYSVTIEGMDTLGNPLGSGLVPTTWSFTTSPPELYLPVAIHP